MGVPSFYRWLAAKYPKIVVDAVEEPPEEGGDASLLPNPNGREFDNLYLDMNGIIHPCFHPDDLHDDDDIQTNSPLTYEDVFNNIFEYIDRILGIVRPRKLLYLAIDGVAPRAKMNQQRTRRFTTAKQRETMANEEDRLRRQFLMEGKEVLLKEESEVSDSNVITPGTDFMCMLSKKLQEYIRSRLANNPSWKGLKVILSDANAPGEGEHKIMSFIRLQRTCKGYNPNTSHCLYGLDADLIMLALATHEVHFSILRENVLIQDPKAGSSSLPSRGWFKQFDLDRVSEDAARTHETCLPHKKKSLVKKPHQFLHVWILREYLRLDMEISNLPDKFVDDVERIIDDFIFICFFAGNDFLPHTPTLEIHEGAIDLLIHVYKEEFKNLGGYLVDMQRVEDRKGGYIKLKRVEKFLLSVGRYEDEIFKKRSEVKERKLKRILAEFEEARDDGEEELCFKFKTTSIEDGTNERSIDRGSGTAGYNVPLMFANRLPAHNAEIIQNTKMLKEQLKSYTRERSDVFKNGLPKENVRLGDQGWKERYYEHKFSVAGHEQIENTRKKVVEKYTEGLCWVLLYYFSGVPSWTWFYPFHYGPFASDMKGLSHTKVKFERGVPFKPFDQLMAVLPPLSAHALPLSYRSLMTDENSSILEFYPSEFEIDTDGKRYLWQGICKLPFIEEDRLLAETKKIEKNLSEEEVFRNSDNVDQLFVHSSDTLSLRIMSASKQNDPIKIDTAFSADVDGFVIPKPEFKNVEASDRSVRDCNILCMLYHPPSHKVHVPRLLEGVKIPERIVTGDDIVETRLWHDIHGGNRQNNGSYKGEGANRNANIGSNKFTPQFKIKEVGKGWSARGRGKMHDFQCGSQNTTNSALTRNQMGGSSASVVHQGCNPNSNFRAPERNSYGRSRGGNDYSHSWEAGIGSGTSSGARSGSGSGSGSSNAQQWRPRFQQSNGTPGRSNCNRW